MARIRSLVLAGAMGGLGLFGQVADAQDNPFSPAITVNGRVITQYELTQRIIFFSLLQPQADATAEARKSLIDDRLRLVAAEELGVTVSPDAVAAGMESFASRVNLSAEEFLKALAPRGVAAETFRDFVSAGVLWREVVKARFLASTKVSETDIDRAIAGGIAYGGEPKVLLSQISIPTDGAFDALALIERIKGDVVSSTGFSAAATIYSNAPNARQGGQLEWIALSQLPPQVAAEVAPLAIGEMTGPIAADGAYLLFYLRDKSTTGGDPVAAYGVDYLRLVLAPGMDGAAIRASADRCEDVMPLARDLPEEAMVRTTLPATELPGDVAAAVQGLDAGETALVTTAAGQAALVMLCARLPLSEIAPSREDVRNQLLNQKMALRAQTYLEELRAEAFVTEP